MNQQTPWVDGLTIGEVFRRAAERYPAQDAMVFLEQGYRASYAELDQQVELAARGLLALGLQKGDHLALWCTNWPQWVLLQFASARVGVVLVTVNPGYRAAEFQYALHQSDARALALIERFKTSDYFQALHEICPDVSRSAPGQLDSEQFPNLRWIISLAGSTPPGMIHWSQLLARGQTVSPAALAEREAQLGPNDTINIQYTSGTTGFPKGAMLTHRNLLLNAYYVGQFQRLTASDRICIPVPLYHCFGCVLGSLCAVVHGATMVFPHESFQARETLAAIHQERCTAIYGVPTMFISQLEHEEFAHYDLKSLRTGIMAGSPCPIELMKRVTERMGADQITIAYGQTEASPVITQTCYDDPIRLRVGTVGRAIPGLEVKIVDPESGRELPDGQPGELCVRGHVVMRGYYKLPEQTAQAIDPDGWLHTGDLSLREPNGYYRITGRLKDMIIRGGENISPREIEECLYRHPKLEEVQVVGVPDRKFGEEILAWIKLRAGQSATEEEIRQYCRASLAHFKVPRYIKFVDVFPLTVSGKIQKFKIRQQAIEELGLQDAAKIETA